MRRSGGFTLIETLVGLTIIAVLVVGIYTVWQRPVDEGPTTTPTTAPSIAVTKAPTSTPAPTQVAEMTTTPTSPAASWKTYENTHFGFSIQYPATWNSGFTTKSETHLFSYPEPTQGYDLLHYPPRGEIAIDVYAFSISPTEASSAQTLQPLIENYFPKAQRISGQEENDPLTSTDSARIGPPGDNLADNIYWSVLGVTKKGRTVGFVLNKDKTTFITFVAQPAPNEEIERNNLSTFNQILSTFQFTD